MVLRSIEKQTIIPEEVLLLMMVVLLKQKKLLTKFQKDSDLNIIHSWQEDNGFRAAKSRNKAIAKSCGDYIILIDGDIILHPKFIQDHVNKCKSWLFYSGI